MLIFYAHNPNFGLRLLLVVRGSTTCRKPKFNPAWYSIQNIGYTAETVVLLHRVSNVRTCTY